MDKVDELKDGIIKELSMMEWEKAKDIIIQWLGEEWLWDYFVDSVYTCEDEQLIERLDYTIKELKKR